MPRPQESLLERISQFVAGIVEGRDPDLGAHHTSVEKNAVLLARRAGCSEDEIAVLSVGARLHDLGKVSLSEHILNKPARLTAAEFSLVKQHAEFGSQLLLPLGLDPRIAEIALYHHENFDGTGYPRGLSGSDIPFLARVIRVTDSFDALTLDRPYHQGVSAEKALQILQKDMSFYDPDLLEAFCKITRGRFGDSRDEARG